MPRKHRHVPRHHLSPHGHHHHHHSKSPHGHHHHSKSPHDPHGHEHSHSNDQHHHHDHDWGYGEEDGPYSWPKHFPQGQGDHQSPIDIETESSHVRFDPEIKPLVVSYEKSHALSIFNNGHGFQVRIDPLAPATLTGGPFGPDEYQLVQFHGHWGHSNSSHGSEHTINGRSFPSEFHFVHYNKKYPTVTEAVNHPDGLAVIGVFLKITERSHPEFQKLIDDLKLIDYDNHDVPLDVEIHPRDFLPADLNRYFTYQGSLTTPPLSECVVWLVMADPLEISADQLAPFHQLHSSHDGQVIDHNFRPVMPINERTVRASFADYKFCKAADAPVSE